MKTNLIQNLERNKELVLKLEKKKQNLEVQIKDLRDKIERQEFTLKNIKEENPEG
jgi:predicted  nucleic acid-binding Zn-ribbon protein